MKVLMCCEQSGIVRESFKKKGWDAWSCDILPTEIPGQHYQRPLEEIVKSKFDMVIGFPPCTFLANSGVRWLDVIDGVPTNKERLEQMLKAITFFNVVLSMDCPKIVVENPIQHKYARNGIRKYDQIIQPWQFGHGETKATCLWLKGVEPLKPTNIVKGRDQRIWKMSPGPERQKERSRTLQGIADAMAEQWSIY